jgi:hypothetical protein
MDPNRWQLQQLSWHKSRSLWRVLCCYRKRSHHSYGDRRMVWKLDHAKCLERIKLMHSKRNVELNRRVRFRTDSSTSNKRIPDLVNVTANYQGDNNHTSSLGSYTLTAPSIVTLNGTVNYSGCTACFLQVVISSVRTHQSWTLTSSTCQSPTYWCFMVSLPNLQDYTVQVIGTSPIGLPPFNISCSSTANIDVYQFSTKTNGQFLCISPG